MRASCRKRGCRGFMAALAGFRGGRAAAPAQCFGVCAGSQPAQVGNRRRQWNSNGRVRCAQNERRGTLCRIHGAAMVVQQFVQPHTQFRDETAHRG